MDSKVQELKISEFESEMRKLLNVQRLSKELKQFLITTAVKSEPCLMKKRKHRYLSDEKYNFVVNYLISVNSLVPLVTSEQVPIDKELSINDEKKVSSTVTLVPSQQVPIDMEPSISDDEEEEEEESSEESQKNYYYKSRKQLRKEAKKHPLQKYGKKFGVSKEIKYKFDETLTELERERFLYHCKILKRGCEFSNFFKNLYKNIAKCC